MKDVLLSECNLSRALRLLPPINLLQASLYNSRRETDRPVQSSYLNQKRSLHFKKFKETNHLSTVVLDYLVTVSKIWSRKEHNN